MKAVPTLGYKSKTDAVVALRAQGLEDGEIARKLEIPVKNVYALAYSRKRAVRPRGEGAYRTVVIERVTLAKLFPHANRRRIHENELVRQLLEAIIEGDLVDAVLDDAEEVAA